ncbi:MAG: hypothetical protein Q7O66_07255 [Dehalococcoidia bacterium]|nr:hypothetical protein [Dehalococcoidia bacterium]
MLYRGIARHYKAAKTLSWWAEDIDHAIQYCYGEDGATLLQIDEIGLKIIECPEAIGESWLAEAEIAEWAASFLREVGADGFRRPDEAGIAICLLPEAIKHKVRIYEQF